MPSRDMQIIDHIQRYCRKISEYMKEVGDDYTAFSENGVLIDAICLNILQIGELANTLSLEYRRSTSSDIPWRDIIGIRNIVAHHYGTIDVERIWDTVKQDIPLLNDFCEAQFGGHEHSLDSGQQM